MNATEILKQDHREVESLIAELEGAGNEGGSGSYAAVFQKMRNMITLHSQIEEETLYPALENLDQTEDQIEEAYTEHDEVATLLADMAGLDPADEDFQSLLQQLKESIQHHVEEEEGEVFPKAEALLGEEQLNSMGDRIEAMKGDSDLSRTATM